MIGAIDPHCRDVVVVGGGIAGLLAAYTLDQQGYEVQLLESNQRLGGLIQTEMTPWGIAESGPHSILATPKVRQLCDELDVKLLPIQSDSKARFILRNGKMRRFPLSPSETTAMMMRASLVSSKGTTNPEGITVAEWAERFLGSPALQYLITPMVQGIYGALPSELTIDAAFPFLKMPLGKSLLGSQLAKLKMKSHRATRNQGTSRAKTKMVAPLRGMGEITLALENRLREKLKDRVVTNCKVDRVPDAGNIVLATPAYVTSQLLANEDPQLSQALLDIQYTPLISVTVFLKRESLATVPRGVGVLTAPGESSRFLGILFNSSSFENRVGRNQWESCTVILGGSRFSQDLSLSDEEIHSLIQREFQLLFGLQGEPVACIIRRQTHAVPKYNQQTSLAWKMARKGWCSKPGRVLFGNYTGKVSLRGMIELSQTKLRAFESQVEGIS